ncbi:hypothetical protein HK104_001190 [Borealophlyctis nickersoniae]|nr:hypothetical protein HK104_001190 [Borealophlyctis nickersoniae]
MNAGAGARSSALALLSVTADLEKDLRQALKVKSPFEKDVANLRIKLRDAYEQIVFLDFDLALSKDVESNLWKIAHYKIIEEFRKRLKAASNGKRGSRSLSAEERREMRVLTASFRSFLTEANGFYIAFIQKLKNRFGLERVDKIVVKALDLEVDGTDRRDPNEVIPPEISTRATVTCHRCLIFLGDLARYREMQADRKEKSWALAKMFYGLALKLIPTNGNPFNQLAVIDTYEGDELGGVERYFRSLVINQPFPTAKENLALLFRKARSKAEAQKDDEKKAVPEEVEFTRKFVALHSLVFGQETNLDGFLMCQSGVLEAYRSLLSRGLLGTDILLRLLVVNLGSLHLRQSPSNLKGKDREVSETGAGATAAGDAEDSVNGALIRFTIDMIVPVFRGVEEAARKKRDKDTRLDLLPVAKTAGKWVLARLIRGDGTFEEDYLDLWTAYASMLTALAQTPEYGQAQSLTDGLWLQYLKEDVEFRGFVPLQGPARELLAECNDTEDGGRDSSIGEHAVRTKQMVEIGVRTCGVPNSRLSVRQEASGTSQKLIFSTKSNVTPASVVPPPVLFAPPGLATSSAPHHTIPLSSDDEEEVILFTGRQRGGSQSLRSQISLDSIPQIPLGDLGVNFAGGQRSVPLERRGSKGYIVDPSSASVTSGLRLTGMNEPVAATTAGGIFGAASSIWTPYMAQPAAAQPTHSAPMVTANGMGDFFHDVSNPFSNAPTPVVTASARPVSIPSKSSSSLFAAPSPPGGSFGTGTDAVNTIGFLGLGSPVNVNGKKKGADTAATSRGVSSGLNAGPSRGPFDIHPGDVFSPPTSYVPPGIRSDAMGSTKPMMFSGLGSGTDHQQWNSAYDYPFANAADTVQAFAGGWQMPQGGHGYGRGGGVESSTVGGTGGLSWLGSKGGLSGAVPSTTTGDAMWMSGYNPTTTTGPGRGATAAGPFNDASLKLGLFGTDSQSRGAQHLQPQQAMRGGR